MLLSFLEEASGARISSAIHPEIKTAQYSPPPSSFSSKGFPSAGGQPSGSQSRDSVRQRQHCVANCGSFVLCPRGQAELCLPVLSCLYDSSQGKSGHIFACGLESGKRSIHFAFCAWNGRMGVFAAQGLMLLIFLAQPLGVPGRPRLHLPPDPPSMSLNPGPLCV